MSDRAKLVGVELSLLWRWQTLVGRSRCSLRSRRCSLSSPHRCCDRRSSGCIAVALGVVAGAALVPLLSAVAAGPPVLAQGRGGRRAAHRAGADGGHRRRDLRRCGRGARSPLGTAVASYVGDELHRLLDVHLAIWSRMGDAASDSAPAPRCRRRRSRCSSVGVVRSDRRTHGRSTLHRQRRHSRARRPRSATAA